MAYVIMYKALTGIHASLIKHYINCPYKLNVFNLFHEAIH
jgi:hypothetical protein